MLRPARKRTDPDGQRRMRVDQLSGVAMKRWILVAALAIAGGSAMADWVSIGDQGPAEIFVDKATITRVGDVAKMTQLQELKAPRTAGNATFISLKQVDEYDCNDPRTRGVEIAAYPQPKAEGTVVASQKGSGAWAKVVPDSTNEKLWKIACGKE